VKIIYTKLMKKIFTFALLILANSIYSQSGASAISTASAVIVVPMTLTEVSAMNFGSLNITSEGTAIINPDDNSITYSNGIFGVNTGVAPTAAILSIGGTQHSHYQVTLPSEVILESQEGGTMILDTLTTWTENGVSSAENSYFLSEQGSDLLRIGGTLHIAQGQGSGGYLGQFTVSIDYN
jgi:hypothetical protein